MQIGHNSQLWYVQLGRIGRQDFVRETDWVCWAICGLNLVHSHPPQFCFHCDNGIFYFIIDSTVIEV